MDKGICLLCIVEHEVTGSHMAFQADWTQERTHTVTLVETNNMAEGQWAIFCLHVRLQLYGCLSSRNYLQHGAEEPTRALIMIVTYSTAQKSLRTRS